MPQKLTHIKSYMKKILINDEPWQTRIAITRNALLQNIYFSSPLHENLEGSFYRGTVTAVLPGIQTAFVDIGQEKAGFLHISEIDRELAISKGQELDPLDDDATQKRRPRVKADISKIFKEGDSILVQVSKEPVYEKGAKLSTCFMLPGRFIVLMPNIPRMAISKKIEKAEDRRALRELVKSNLPETMGAIIRTTSEGQDEKAILKDITCLLDTWREIQANFEKSKPQERIYKDIALPLQIIRDHLDADVEAVITDSKENQSILTNFIKSTAPEHSANVRLYKGETNIFDFYNIEKQIDLALEKKVQLKSGGSLIIEAAEAMTVIDVNTGKFTGKRNLEDTIFKTNLEAAEEVVRQLRLRNVGGLIVIDFIDMASSANQRKLSAFFEKTLREQDKFQSVVLKISELGLAQMTRKRSGKTLIAELTNNCCTCSGSGFVRSVPTKSHAILRSAKYEILTKKPGTELTIQLPSDVFEYISSCEYNTILTLERTLGIKLTLEKSRDQLPTAQYKIIAKR